MSFERAVVMGVQTNVVAGTVHKVLFIGGFIGVLVFDIGRV